MPRTVMALLVGAALAMSGTTLQGITRNPLADPGIFGVVSGASLAVVTGIAFFGLSRPVPTMIAAMLGSLAAAVDRKSTRLNSSHVGISYAVFCLYKKTP